MPPPPTIHDSPAAHSCTAPGYHLVASHAPPTLAVLIARRQRTTRNIESHPRPRIASLRPCIHEPDMWMAFEADVVCVRGWRMEVNHTVVWEWIGGWAGWLPDAHVPVPQDTHRSSVSSPATQRERGKRCRTLNSKSALWNHTHRHHGRWTPARKSKTVSEGLTPRRRWRGGS